MSTKGRAKLDFGRSQGRKWRRLRTCRVGAVARKPRAKAARRGHAIPAGSGEAEEIGEEHNTALVARAHDSGHHEADERAEGADETSSQHADKPSYHARPEQVNLVSL